MKNTENFVGYNVTNGLKAYSVLYTEKLNFMRGLISDAESMLKEELTINGEISPETQGIYDFLTAHMPTVNPSIEEVVDLLKQKID